MQIKLMEEDILLMRAEGMINREVADHFGLNLKQNFESRVHLLAQAKDTKGGQ